jgi:D-alanine-D-alanine ligase
MGCEGVARVDWRYDPAASTGPAFLEINTQPGMTPLSLVPAAAAYEGMSYDALVLKILGGGGVINL